MDIQKFITELPECIISGGARGVDSLAAAFARENNIPLVEFLPKYDRFGRSAPLKRNIEIVEACDKVLAFWNGTSRGTLYTINAAKRMGKPVEIVHI